MRSREPIFNAPAVVVAVLGLLVAMHIGLSLLPDRQWSEAIELLAIIPSRFSGNAGVIAGGELAAYTSLVTHQLVHGDIPTSCSTRLGCWHSAALSQAVSAPPGFSPSASSPASPVD